MLLRKVGDRVEMGWRDAGLELLGDLGRAHHADVCRQPKPTFILGVSYTAARDFVAIDWH